MFRIAMAWIGFLCVSASFFGCRDPNDPQTWIKKLRNPKEATMAIRKLQEIGDPVAIGPLADLYKDFESPTILKAIIDLTKKKAPKSERAIQALIDALEFTEDQYHNATLAANTLAELGATAAITPLTKVLERPMPIKSRANLAKLAAIKALAKLGDPKAVPALIQVLEKKPEEQDFLLNKEAAQALGAFQDHRAIPVLIRALFMASTIQGTSYPQAHVALLQIGAMAIPSLLNALNGNDTELEKMAKELEFEDGVILGKISRVLGDMGAKEAVEPLLAFLKNAKVSGEDYTKGLDGVIEALGKIGDERAGDLLIALLTNAKANYKLRVQVCPALTVLGSKKALPPLLAIAEKGEVEGGFTNLREAAVMAYGRLVGSEAEASYSKVEGMVNDPKFKEYPDTKKVFEEALDRMKLAKKCNDDALCYGKALSDRSVTLAQKEKAGIMIGVLPNGRDALPLLIKALPEREPVLRLFYLRSAIRVGKSTDNDLIQMLEALAEKDSKIKIQYLGADLAREDKVALAVLKRKK